MTILNFVTQEQLDSLDMDDPQAAFMNLVNFAQRSFSAQTSKLDLDERNDYQKREEIRHNFMNVMAASAKRLEIEPFVSMDVPRQSNFNENEFRNFKDDLDNYVTQIMLDNSMKSKKNSVEILPQSKDKIRTYVHSLRECVEKSNMQGAKRKALLDKLDAFEKELEKRRVNILAVALVSFEVLGIPGSLWGSAEIAHKLINNVMQEVAEARVIDQQTRSIAAPSVPKALSPPRSEDMKASTPAWKKQPTPSDLDDEIPF